ncbi:Protein of unknown function DUF814 [Penicillium brevicompactum]
MVYYFTSNVVSPSAFIYVGKDKFENEDLIQFGLDNDVWYATCDFQFDLATNLPAQQGLSSFRLATPMPLIVRAPAVSRRQFIERTRLRNKKDNITIIYTPWSNLKKDGSMAAGQVTFHNHKLVRKIYVKQRENPIVNRLNKTRVEKYPDLRAEKEEDTRKKARGDRKTREEQRAKEKKKQQEYEQLKWQKDHAYDDMFTDEQLEASNNQDRDEDFLDDFM